MMTGSSWSWTCGEPRRSEGLNLSSGWPIDAAFAQKVHDAGLVAWRTGDVRRGEPRSQRALDRRGLSV
jgi:hypothetical protein